MSAENSVLVNECNAHQSRIVVLSEENIGLTNTVAILNQDLTTLRVENNNL